MFHVEDVKFGPCEGKNVMCMDSNVDLQGNYPTTFDRTANLTTFMQASSARYLK